MLFFCFPLKFEKPGRRENFDYPDMAKEAMTKALADAKIPFSDVKQAVVGYVYGSLINVFWIFLCFMMKFSTGDSTAGQRAVYEVGMTGNYFYEAWLTHKIQSKPDF